MKPVLLFTVCRIRVIFGDGIGNKKKIWGTGFWIEINNVEHFVTNRHNVDPRLKLGHDTTYQIESAEIQLRVQNPRGRWHSAVGMARVANLNECLRLHAQADVAELANPTLQPDNPLLGHKSFGLELLATPEFFSEKLEVMDAASFYGYPIVDGREWWDQRWTLPIGRAAHVASWPMHAFENKQIPTSDCMLVSGFSFSGSSGSVVMSHPKGINFNPQHVRGGKLRTRANNRNYVRALERSKS